MMPAHAPHQYAPMFKGIVHHVRRIERVPQPCHGACDQWEYRPGIIMVGLRDADGRDGGWCHLGCCQPTGITAEAQIYADRLPGVPEWLCHWGIESYVGPRRDNGWL